MSHMCPFIEGDYVVIKAEAREELESYLPKDSIHNTSPYSIYIFGGFNNNRVDAEGIEKCLGTKDIFDKDGGDADNEERGFIEKWFSPKFHPVWKIFTKVSLNSPPEIINEESIIPALFESQPIDPSQLCSCNGLAKPVPLGLAGNCQMIQVCTQCRKEKP